MPADRAAEAQHEKVLRTANEMADPTTKVANINVIGTTRGKRGEATMRTSLEIRRERKPLSAAGAQ
jgi:hypothetical protein